MKSKEEIEQLAFKSYGDRFLKGSFIHGYTQCQEDMADKKYTEEDMLNASKYGYEFRDTTSFPEHKFEDSCINNTKQWINSLNKQD